MTIRIWVQIFDLDSLDSDKFKAYITQPRQANDYIEVVIQAEEYKKDAPKWDSPHSAYFVNFTKKSKEEVQAIRERRIELTL